MATLDFIELNDPYESDYEIPTDGDSDYKPSSDSDSGDEVEPSPRKKKTKGSPKQQGMSSARSLPFNADEASDEDDIPLSKFTANHYASSDDDDDNETLASIQRNLRKDMPEADDMTEEQLAKVLDEPFWENDVPYEQPNYVFGGEEEAPHDHLKTPLEFFKDFITDDIIENMVQQTNLYSVQVSGKSVSTTSDEIHLFIGLYLRMGLIQAYSVRAFWASETCCEKIADHMARNRFEKLASSIHFIDNFSLTEEMKKDKLWKLRPWLDGLQASLNKLPQEEQSAVDEVMIPFKGRSSVKQYMRNKPHKWGFKMWGRAGASGILYEFEVYQGSGGSEQSTGQLSKTGEVVVRMTSNIPDGLYYKVFADNLFTSLPPVKSLKERKILYVGTVRINRLHGCNLPSEQSPLQWVRLRTVWLSGGMTTGQ